MVHDNFLLFRRGVFRVVYWKALDLEVLEVDLEVLKVDLEVEVDLGVPDVDRSWRWV